MATLQATTVQGAIRAPNGTTSNPSIIRSGDSDTGIRFNGNDIEFIVGGINALTINGSGYITKPRNSLFVGTDTRAIDLTGPVLDSSNFYNSIPRNVGSRFTDSNGRFTANIAGYYEFNFWCAQSSAGADTNVRLRINGASNFGPLTEAYNQGVSGGCSINVCVSCIVFLNVNDYLDIQVARIKTNSGVQHKKVTIRYLG
jgi:hypothetical protein